MYAIIRTGGKQYKVQPGDVLQIEKIDSDLGSEVELSDVLLIGGEKTLVGQPLVAGAKVTAVITKQAKARKVIVFKKKRRNGYRKFATHRQHFTEVFIKSISSPDGQIEQSSEQPKVVNVQELRQQKEADRIAARIARAEAQVGSGAKKQADSVAPKASKKKSVKKVASKKAKKAAPKKKVAKKAKTTKKTK